MPNDEYDADACEIKCLVDEIAGQLGLVLGVGESAAGHSSACEWGERRSRDDYQHPRAENVPPPTVDEYAGTSENRRLSYVQLALSVKLGLSWNADHSVGTPSSLVYDRDRRRRISVVQSNDLDALG